MKLLFKGNSIGKALADISAYLLLAQCIAEFLKIQRIHTQMTLLRGDDNILDVLLYRNKRACFDIVVSAVGNKILDALPCFGVHLHLVKDDKRLTLIQLHTVVGGQQHEERVKIVHVLGEIVLDLVGALSEVDQDVALIFIFAEFLTDR